MTKPSSRVVAYLWIYGNDRTRWSGTNAGASSSAVNGGADIVHLSFSSNGGYVADGIFLHNHIRALPLRLVIYNTGSVGSIAVSVFLAAHERYCSKHAMFMIHPTTTGSAEGLSARRVQSTLDAALANDDRPDNILRQYASISEDILAARRYSEIHIAPRQAVDFGLVQGMREFALPQGQNIAQI